MKFLLGSLVFFMLCFCSATAQAKALEIKSENFVLTGEFKQKDGEGLLRDLELFRKNVFLVLGVDASPELIPVKVHIAKNEKSFKAITGVGSFGGVYTMTHNGPAFVLNGKNGFRRGKGARHVALHEYTHHIVSTYTDRDYPLWYNEGFANFLATFTYRDGTFRVGDPYDAYAYSLKQKNWMPMTVVLASMETYPFNLGDTSKIGLRTTGQFYAQTWLTTHYLRNEEKYKGALTDYVRRLNMGERSIPAFKAAMGITPEAFEIELKAYFKENRYNVQKYTTADRESAVLKVRALTETEAQMAKLNAMRSFVFSPERKKAVIEAFEEHAVAYGENADILSAQADLTALNATTKETYDVARALSEKALALEPENIEANNIAALVTAHQYVSNLGGTQADIKKIRQHAAKVLRHNSQIPLANYSYALSYKDDYMPPENALNAAAFALDYYRDKGFMGSNLGLATILVNGEKYDEALPPVNRAIIWAKEPGMRVAAQSLKKYIESERAR